jgi:carbon storage regulator CsrA
VPSLKLTRRAGEALVLPDLGVIVRVLEVQGGSVRFAIEAPPGVAVSRSELTARQAARLAAKPGVAKIP